MTHGRDPRLARVPRRRDVDLATLRVQREPHERHVVLPADEAADATHRRVADAEPACVPHPPDPALGGGRYQLAGAVQHRAVRADQDGGVVEGATAGIAVTLANADR